MSIIRFATNSHRKVLSGSCSRRRNELTVNIRRSHLRDASHPTMIRRVAARVIPISSFRRYLFSLEYATSAVRVTAAVTGNRERERKKLSLVGTGPHCREASVLASPPTVPRSPLTIRTEAKCRRRAASIRISYSNADSIHADIMAGGGKAHGGAGNGR